MAVSTFTFIILATIVACMTQAKETEPDNVLDVVLALKQEWTMKYAKQQNEISSLKRKCEEQGNDSITELKKKTEKQKWTMKFAKQQSEISSLKKKCVEQDNEITELKKKTEKQEWTMKFAKQQSEISSLKKKCVEQENEITELNKKTEKQDSEVISLRKNCFELENEVVGLKRKEIEQENAAEELNRSSAVHDKQGVKPHDAFQGQKDTRRMRERQTLERVAFSLYLSHSQEHTGVGQKIKFDAVILNEGNGYNLQTADFVAPTQGIYLFAYTIAKGFVGQALVHLVKNGNAINSAIADVHTNYQDTQSSNVALIELDVGDVVSVEEYSQPDAKLYSSSHLRFTTFSGVLLM